MTTPSPSLADLSATARRAIGGADSLTALETLRVRYLGKKGEITAQLKRLGGLEPAQRKTHGKELNRIKGEIQKWLEARHGELENSAVAARLLREKIDVTQPGRGQVAGALHPVSRTLQRMEAIFDRLGFDIATGPEIEDEYYNFEALNIPADHPARAMHDTFYIDRRTVLRTHTSPVQIRYMHGHQPPIKVIAPGRVYRCDSDVTHTPMFHQLEGLAVDGRSPSPTSKASSFTSFKNFLKPISECAFARPISRSPSRRRKWISPACFASGAAAESANTAAGSKCSAAAWCIPKF